MKAANHLDISKLQIKVGGGSGNFTIFKCILNVNGFALSSRSRGCVDMILSDIFVVFFSSAYKFFEDWYRILLIKYTASRIDMCSIYIFKVSCNIGICI